MEPTNKNYRNINKLSVADLLCSAGYLPPRNEQDIERFERIYRGRIFETEAYTVNASAIFDKMIDEEKSRAGRVRQMVDQSLLRAASGIKYNSEECIIELLYQDIDKKK